MNLAQAGRHRHPGGGGMAAGRQRQASRQAGNHGRQAGRQQDALPGGSHGIYGLPLQVLKGLHKAGVPCQGGHSCCHEPKVADGTAAI